MTAAAQPMTPPSAPSLEGVSLAALVATVVARRPGDVLIQPPLDGAPLSWAAFHHAATWLSRMLANVAHDQPAAVLLPMMLDMKAMIAVAACLRAGLTPMLVRPDLDVDAMTAKAESIGASIAIGAAPDPAIATLDTMRDMAARSFGMRCVAGFGANVPEGVIPLDRLLAEAKIEDGRGPMRHGALFLDGDPPVVITEGDLLTAGFDIARTLKVPPSARIVTTMTGGSLGALASGLGLGIIAGAELVPLGLFSLTALWNCFAGGKPVHLVMPGELEPALVASGMLAHKGLASVTYVHRGAAPVLLRPPMCPCRIADIGPSTPARLMIRTRL